MISQVIIIIIPLLLLLVLHYVMHRCDGGGEMLAISLCIWEERDMVHVPIDSGDASGKKLRLVSEILG